MAGTRGYSRLDVDEHVQAQQERRWRERVVAVTDWTTCEGCGIRISARTLDGGRCAVCVACGAPKRRDDARL